MVLVKVRRVLHKNKKDPKRQNNRLYIQCESKTARRYIFERKMSIPLFTISNTNLNCSCTFFIYPNISICSFVQEFGNG